MWSSPLKEGDLGKGSKCVHQVPYPTVEGQTQEDHHLERPKCKKKNAKINQTIF